MPIIVVAFRIPLSLSTVPIAVGKLAYVLLLIPGGMIVDRYGPRICVIFGILGLAIVLSMYAIFVVNFATLLTAHIAMAVFASVSGVPVYSIFIAQWFRHNIGLAMGLVLAGYSAAGTALPALLGPIASTMGWRVAMGVQSCLLWFVGLPVSIFLLKENSQHQSDDTVQDEEQFEEYQTQDQPLASQMSWTFVCFGLSYILLQYCFGCLGENILFFLTIDRGMTLSAASLYFSALNFASFTAKLVGGHLGDKFDRFHVASLSSGLASVGIYVLFIAPPFMGPHGFLQLTHSPTAVLCFILLFGFGYGATFNSLYALTPIVFGKENLGRTQSTLFGLGLIGNAIGSVITGVLRAKYDTYDLPFLVAAVLCTANFFLFNITRLTLGGSIAGLEALKEGRYEGVEELDAREEALRKRIGPGSEHVSPVDSMHDLRAAAAGMADYDSIERNENYPLRTSQSAHSRTTGMVAEGGYPIVRDWSSSSLRAHTVRSTRSILKRRGLTKSSTFDAMIDSGILSASLEPVGYVGRHSRIKSISHTNLRTTDSSGG